MCQGRRHGNYTLQPKRKKIERKEFWARSSDCTRRNIQRRYFKLFKFLAYCLTHIKYSKLKNTIEARMKRILDENQPREQTGFRERFSVTDHLQALGQ